MSAERYAIESLAATGFVVLDGPIAALLRPDLWRSGLEARADLSRASSRASISALPATTKFLARIDGRAELVPALARSDVDLARRITAITGLRCVRTFREADLAGDRRASAELAIPPRKASSARPRGDLWAHVSTKEAGRKCSQCDNLTAGHACGKPAQSGVSAPSAGVLRRCIAFVPHWDAVDGRNGPSLWPEIVGKQPAAQLTAP